MCFSIGNGPRRLANCRGCFSIPVGSILELLGSSSKSTVVHHSSVQMHQSSVLFCTIRQHSSAPFISYSSAPFVSSVLHHSSATVLHHSSATVLHHSSVQFCTIRQFSSAPFVSYQSAPCDYAILQFCINEQSCCRCDYTLSTI